MAFLWRSRQGLQDSRKGASHGDTPCKQAYPISMGICISMSISIRTNAGSVTISSASSSSSIGCRSSSKRDSDAEPLVSLAPQSTDP